MSVPNPLRIAFCHYTSDICGGSDRSLFDTVTQLPRERFYPTVILRHGDPMAEAYEAAGVQTIQVRLVPPRRALEFGKLARFFLWFWPSTFQVARAIRRTGADVVHVNTLYNLQGAFAARLAGKRLVWHVRELGADSMSVRVMLRLVALLAARGVAISTAVAGSMQACGTRLRLIANGIDLSEYEQLPDAQHVRAGLGLAPACPLVTTVGRIEPWKGQHVLIEAAPAILARNPDARILVVGGPAVNKPEYEREIKARCRDLGVEEAVIFTGIRKDVPGILAASNVLVLPSVTPEPFGRTVIEAMAAQCPVVATAAGGPLDTVVDGETGWLVEPGDAPALAEKVCQLLERPEEARRMGQRGRQRAIARFSLDRLLRDMAALFEETACS